MRLFKFAPVAALAFLGLTGNPVPAAAGGCGYNGCETVAPAPQPVVVYRSGCGCGGSTYYQAYAPAYAYPSAAYYGYASYGYADAGYGYAGYGYAGAAYRAAVAPYRYVNRFNRPRLYAGARRWR